MISQYKQFSNGQFYFTKVCSFFKVCLFSRFICILFKAIFILRLDHLRFRFEAQSFSMLGLFEVQSSEVQYFEVGSYSILSLIRGLVFRDWVVRGLVFRGLVARGGSFKIGQFEVQSFEVQSFKIYSMNSCFRDSFNLRCCFVKVFVEVNAKIESNDNFRWHYFVSRRIQLTCTVCTVQWQQISEFPLNSFKG